MKNNKMVFKRRKISNEEISDMDQGISIFFAEFMYVCQKAKKQCKSIDERLKTFKNSNKWEEELYQKRIRELSISGP